MANFCFENDKIAQAISFFKLAEKYYPLSKNVHAALEKAYIKSTDKKLSNQMQKE